MIRAGAAARRVRARPQRTAAWWLVMGACVGAAACTVEIPDDPRGVPRDAGSDVGNDVIPQDVRPELDGDIVEDVDGSDVSPDAAPVLLAAVVDGVFVPSCSPCHTDRVSGELSLRPRPALSEALAAQSFQAPQMARIAPGFPDESYLWRKVLGSHDEVGGSGNQMPLSGALSSAQLQLLEQWILDGALE